MRLVQFSIDGKQSIGVEVGKDCIVNLNEADRTFPNNLVALLKAGESYLNAAETFSKSGNYLVEKCHVTLLPPITGCEKIICIGMNYKDHCLELGMPLPEEPIVLSKFPNTIIGDGDSIEIPKISNCVDWEIELAVVIGKEGKDIKVDEANNYIAGYMVANDVGARDWFGDRNANQCLLGNTFDTFCPIGPALVTKDEIPDPNNLNLTCKVNGEIMQSSNSKQLIHKIDECISWVSNIFTIAPGDILLTGTPPGVGAARNPPIFLKEGDTVVCEIEKIGKITNKVKKEFNY